MVSLDRIDYSVIFLGCRVSSWLRGPDTGWSLRLPIMFNGGRSAFRLMAGRIRVGFKAGKWGGGCSQGLVHVVSLRGSGWVDALFAMGWVYWQGWLLWCAAWH